MISRHILIPSNNSRSTTKITCRLAGRRCLWFSFKYYLLCTRLIIIKVFFPSLKCVFFLVPKKFLGILFDVPGRCAPDAITNSKYKETKLSVAALNGRRVFACISWHRAYIKYTPITPRRLLYNDERFTWIIHFIARKEKETWAPSMTAVDSMGKNNWILLCSVDRNAKATVTMMLWRRAKDGKSHFRVQLSIA